MAVWPGLFGRIQLSKKTDVKIDNLGSPVLKQESNFFFSTQPLCRFWMSSADWVIVSFLAFMFKGPSNIVLLTHFWLLKADKATDAAGLVCFLASLFFRSIKTI